MYDPSAIVDVLAHNVRATMSPFGVPGSLANTWWKRESLPREGEALLFTGLMYQYAPYIATATRLLERFEGTAKEGMVRFGRFVPPVLSGLGLHLLTPQAERERAGRTLSDIVTILTASGLCVAYRPELDDYSGILLYDLGSEKEFARHARAVTAKLRRAGIGRIVCVDPHTAYALKVLYPKHADADFEVTAYFEHIRPELFPAAQEGTGPERVTLHDPCFYGRYLELSDAPRRVLAGLGVACSSIRNEGTYTDCCGGPAESLSPRLSGEVGGRRLAELTAPGAPVVAMCPICLGNLRRLGAEVTDFASLVADRLHRRNTTNP
ncbi:putative protein of unknown function DUF224 cysteine-rich region domain protein [Desulfovibrio sp. X2]|uniref:(Fe-S)-binding protein n=1 Tax=Desulfovibrio sp. X2 TaxID=941449 RepID=UPI000358D160|nr:(Fe-S)-binding protein [Desulfovibrio sp. X2]EPR41960.1 putative protein of unknown function DUF224 cysteine-rich region domain protein [Desulfovibrio sp. X2]